MTKILIVEDDPTLREALVYNLRHQSYIPVPAEDAPEAIRLARQEKPDLVLLDVMLPSGSGFDVCRSIRTFSSAPIIMLTARDEEVDRVLGLEIGADDYVTKPFNLRELLARIHANLRRVTLDQGGNEDEILQAGPVRIDVGRREAVVSGHMLVLQPREFDLLTYLVRHPGRVLTRDRLLTSVWGHDFVGARTVDVHIRRIRAKLENAGVPNVIRTVHGVGYTFAPV